MHVKGKLPNMHNTRANYSIFHVRLISLVHDFCKMSSGDYEFQDFLFIQLLIWEEGIITNGTRYS